MIDELDDLELEDDHGIDMWAIRVVVREGKYMALNRQEQILAAHLFRAKGVTPLESSLIMRTSHHLVDKFLRLSTPIPVSEVDEAVIGARVRNPPSFSRKLIQPDRTSRRRGKKPVS